MKEGIDNPDEILEAAKGKLKEVLILAFDENDLVYISGNVESAKGVFLSEIYKHALLNGDFEK